MIRTVYCGVLAVLLTSCASTPVPAPPAPAGHQAGGEGAVLAAMDRYMHAISANDLQTMAAMQTPDGTTYRARVTKGGSMEIVGQPNAYWVDPARADGRAVRER